MPSGPAMRIEAVIRRLGVIDYRDSWHAMRKFTEGRNRDTPDELWLLQHPPVYTTGLRKVTGEHVRLAIPLMHSDRGGEITYHGPGQLVVYIMMDLRRRAWGVKQLVTALEQAAIDFLQDHAITAERRRGAPGVYVHGKKIAALGLRVRRGCSYHGLAVNIDMDLGPFREIVACGIPGLEVTQLSDLVAKPGLPQAEDALLSRLRVNLGYNSFRIPGTHG